MREELYIAWGRDCILRPQEFFFKPCSTIKVKVKAGSYIFCKQVRSVAFNTAPLSWSDFFFPPQTSLSTRNVEFLSSSRPAVAFGL